MPEVVTERWTEKVAEEHRRLGAMVAEIRTFLDQPRPEPGVTGSHTWASDLTRRLARLHDELFRHFRYEEEGGMVEDLEAAHPRATGQIEVLVDEHQEMLGEIRGLMSAALTYAEGRNPEDPALRRRLNDVLDSLHDHECRENDLILQLETHDLGLGD